MGDRTCERCRWFSKEIPPSLKGRGLAAICNGQMLNFFSPKSERAHGNCGPSGRYWEPKKDQQTDDRPSEIK